MIFLPIVILAIIQGITEFLPISSSGHLVLAHAILNDAEHMNDLAQKRLDIAVHIGTLLAVIAYFHKDFISLIIGFSDMLFRKKDSINAKKAGLITIASIPVIICGFILFLLDPTLFDSLEIIAWTTLIFGILLYLTDKSPERTITIEQYSWKESLIYGIAQCFALIPGVSRSGITMTAGRFLGHSRVEAARFSLLMGMVTIAAAGLLTSLSLFKDETISNEFLTMLGVGIAVSFFTAYLSIFIMMRWLKNNSFKPFVVYRIILGIALLTIIYGGFIPENMQIGM